MKTTFKLTVLLAAVLMFAACKPEPVELLQERSIIYTVDNNRYEVNLKTDAEFDALLERFCDYAENGHRLSFHSTKHSVKGQGSKEASTFSTSSREEMKAWMRRMEDAGKTVTVIYNSETGTYNGLAYTPAPSQNGCYNGLVISVPTPIMHSGENLPAMVVALQISADSTLIISDNGRFGEDLCDTNFVSYMGDTVTLCGTLMTVLDYNGNTFLALEIGGGDGPTPAPVPNPGGELLTYECDMMPRFSYIISFDTTNHRVYISLHDSTYMPNVPTGSGLPLGIYEYSPSSTANAYMLTDGMNETTGPYTFQFSGGFGSNTLTFNTSDMSHPVTLVRTYKWSTYLCLDMNLDIVMHTAKDSLWDAYFVILGQLASNIVPRVNCQTPFLYGRFQMTSPQWYGGNNPFDMEIYQPVNDTEGYWINTLSIEGEPTVDHHFTIKVDWPYESTYCTDTYNFYRP